MAFPFAYAGLLFLTLAGAPPAGPRSKRVVVGGLAIAVVVIGADLAENFVLLELVDRLGQDSTSSAAMLGPLAWAAWTKWLGIGALAAQIGLIRWPAARLRAAACASVGLLALAAALVKQPMTSELMALAVTLMIAAFCVGAVWTAATAKR